MHTTAVLLHHRVIVPRNKRPRRLTALGQTRPRRFIVAVSAMPQKAAAPTSDRRGGWSRGLNSMLPGSHDREPAKGSRVCCTEILQPRSFGRCLITLKSRLDVQGAVR